MFVAIKLLCLENGAVLVFHDVAEALHLQCHDTPLAAFVEEFVSSLELETTIEMFAYIAVIFESHCSDF